MQKQKKPKRPTLLAGAGGDDLYLRPGASGVSLVDLLQLGAYHRAIQVRVCARLAAVILSAL